MEHCAANNSASCGAVFPSWSNSSSTMSLSAADADAPKSVVFGLLLLFMLLLLLLLPVVVLLREGPQSSSSWWWWTQNNPVTVLRQAWGDAWSFVRHAFTWQRSVVAVHELRPLLDRRDIILVSLAASFLLQFADPEVGHIFHLHIGFDAGGDDGLDPVKIKKLNRVLFRTLATLSLYGFGNVRDKRAVVRWLRDVGHANVPDYHNEQFQLVALASFVWPVVKCYQILGVAPKFLDAIVAEQFSLFNYIHEHRPKKDRAKMPLTVKELDELIRSRRVDFQTVKFWWQNAIVGRRASHFDKDQMTLLDRLFRDDTLFVNVDDDETSSSWWKRTCQGLRIGRLRLFQPMYTHFHQLVCPQSKTLMGFIEDLTNPDNPHWAVERRYFLACWKEIQGKPFQLSSKYGEGSSSSSKPRFASFVSRLAGAIKGVYESFIEAGYCGFHYATLEKCRAEGTLPNHLGIIMDGNRRYAREKKMNAVWQGHKGGSIKLEQCIAWCVAAGIKNLTVWAFSTDNFKRTKEEIAQLFEVMKHGYITNANSNLTEANRIRVRVIGALDRLPTDLKDAIDYAAECTRHNTGLNLTLAIGYSGQDEIARAAATVHALGQEMTIENLQKQTYLAQLGLPPVDSIIRTSGEHRLSGFMLWDCQYAEFAIIQDHWPDLKESAFYRLVTELSQRKRRLGK